MSNDLHVYALKIDRNCQCYILEGLQTNVAFFIYGAILHQMIILRDLYLAKQPTIFVSPSCRDGTTPRQQFFILFYFYK